MMQDMKVKPDCILAIEPPKIFGGVYYTGSQYCLHLHRYINGGINNKYESDILFLKDGSDVMTQIYLISDEYVGIPGRTSIATHILYFMVEDLPPLGSKYFKIESTIEDHENMLEDVPIDTTFGFDVGGNFTYNEASGMCDEH